MPTKSAGKATEEQNSIYSSMLEEKVQAKNGLILQVKKRLKEMTWIWFYRNIMHVVMSPRNNNM